MPNSIFIVGPTCVGKSSVSIQFAKNVHAEIVSCDSMQVYRGMDIGTAKPSKEEQKIIPYHMIDCVDLTQGYNVSLYARDANLAISEVQSRNKIPLVIGGTGLYVKALIDGLFEGPSSDEKIRKKLEERSEKEGLPRLCEELKKIDPVSSVKIKPNDKRRIIRALEVYYFTGKPISFFQTQWGSTPPSLPLQRGGIILIGLNRERADLYERINARVDKMFEYGLIEEVKGLIKKGLLENKTARQALGYKEVIDFLDGKYSLDLVKELIKQNTRRFAKRQLTWFRKDDRVKWILIGREESTESVVEKITAINF